MHHSFSQKLIVSTWIYLFCLCNFCSVQGSIVCIEKNGNTQLETSSFKGGCCQTIAKQEQSLSRQHIQACLECIDIPIAANVFTASATKKISHHNLLYFNYKFYSHFLNSFLINTRQRVSTDSSAHYSTTLASLSTVILLI